jgi:ketosteroid isomerase-like protein
MVMLAILSLLIGAVLGSHLKVYILLPAIFSMLALVIFIKSACGYDLWSLALSAVLATVGLQIGYLVGSWSVNKLDSAVEQSHAALAAILKGDSSAARALYSDQDDVTFGNPFGPYGRGRMKVEETLADAASNYRDGELTDVESVAQYVSGDLACVVEVEHGRSKIGGANNLTPVALRVTSIFRLEHRAWKLVHQHADQITTSRPTAGFWGAI